MSRRQNFKAPIRISNISSSDGPHAEPEKDLWSSMLDSVASGKKLPEKNIIVLGGNPETQKEFLETLASDTTRPQERHRKKAPIANEFALGYTYHDVLDTDHEDILARLSTYLLSEPSPSFTPLLAPLFTPRSVPETLLVLLLDWAEPWLWVRQLRDRLIFLNDVTSSLNDETKEVMTETMKEWQQHKRGGPAYDASGASGSEANIAIPLSQGEWDEPIGVPLCVVCHNADKIETLEREQGWREEEFDFILQFLRTVLMKHGASLIYTSTSAANSLPTLIHSSLGIHSTLKRHTIKHNVIDRDRVLVPPMWDSWGKIRVLREGFDVEGVSSGWSIDIRQRPSSSTSEVNDPENIANLNHSAEGAVLPAYEETIKDPKIKSHSNNNPNFSSGRTLEIEGLSTQDFLATQLEIMDRLKAEEEKAFVSAGESLSSSSSISTITQPSTSSSFTLTTPPKKDFVHHSRVNEHIGPVQFNMGGIQVDADDMVRKISTSQSESSSEAKKVASPTNSAFGGTPDGSGKGPNEALASFFAGLIKRGNGGSGAATPTK